jgi:uncharacterized protein (TIGR03437 family)
MSARVILSSLAVVMSLAPPATGADGPTVYRVATVAGSTPSQSTDVAGTDLVLSTPLGLVRDSQGNFYFSDYGNHVVRKLDTAGHATVIAGTGTAGFTGNGGPATSAQIQYPRAMALDGSKYLYVSEVVNNHVRRLDLGTGIITHVLGNGTAGFNGDGNTGTATAVSEVLGMAVDSSGNLIFTDTDSHRIRKLSATDGSVSTIAGSGTAGFSGDGGPALSAQLNRPGAIAIHPNGDIYFSELANGRIRRIHNGTITTMAGSPSSVLRTGAALQVRVLSCTGMTLDSTGNILYFTDEDTDTIRALDLNALQVSLIGGSGTQGFTGDNIPAVNAAISNPNHIVVQPGGVAFADAGNNRIRAIAIGGNITTIAGGKIITNGDGGLATSATLNRPTTVRLETSSNTILIADPADCLIRRVDNSGHIQTVAGQIGTCQLPGLNAAAADLPGNVYWVSSQGVFVRTAADPPAGRLRIPIAFNDILVSRDQQRVYLLSIVAGKVAQVVVATPANLLSQGTAGISVFAGGSPGSGGDGGPALANVFFIPQALAEDFQGNLYILDAGNTNVRRVDRQTNKISTVVTSDLLSTARGLAIDLQQNVIVSTTNQIARFNPAGDLISVVGTGNAGLTPDGTSGRLALLNAPLGLAAGLTGGLIFSDSGNHLVRSLTPVTATKVVALSSKPSLSGAIPVQVMVTAADGSGVGGLDVDFAITPSSATLSAHDAVTDPTGTASLNVTLNGGPAVVTATVAGLTPVSLDVITAGSGPTGFATLPAISQANTLSDFGGAKKIAPGGWMEIFGSNFSTVTQQWASSDFQNGIAPTTLAGVRVTMNGIPAFVYYVSPGQIDCVAPDGIGTGNVSVVVSTSSGSSTAFQLSGALRAPSLLAPASFAAGSKRYAVALFPDSVYAGPDGLVAGGAFRRAQPGDRLLLFGVGFGATNPPTPAGQVVSQATALPNFSVQLGGVPATVEYDGLAGGFVGLYQFNIVVPPGVSGDVPLTLSVDGVSLDQSLWIATAN